MVEGFICGPCILRMLERSIVNLVVSLLSVVDKVFEKFVNNRLIDHLEKWGLYLISSIVSGLFDQLQISCRSSIVSDRIARACNRSGATL